MENDKTKLLDEILGSIIDKKYKSSIEQLKDRGYITEKDVEEYKNKNLDEIMDLLFDRKPAIRTIGYRLIGKVYLDKKELTKILCENLIIEEKLYTKLEICDTLVKECSDYTSDIIKYIGKVGENQHIELPRKKFEKKSYPLPRDLIVRVLIRIGKKAIFNMLEEIKESDKLVVRELIDGIGYICFYEEASNNEYEQLKKCYIKNFEDKIIRWKIIRAFSAFNTDENIKFLNEQLENETEKEIEEEINRSLEIIKLKGKKV